MLVVMTVSLIDFHNRLYFGIVVPPVGPHVGSRGVAGANPFEMLQIIVQQFDVRRAFLRRAIQNLLLLTETGKGTYAAAGKHDVAVTAGITDAAFMG